MRSAKERELSLWPGKECGNSKSWKRSEVRGQEAEAEGRAAALGAAAEKSAWERGGS